MRAESQDPSGICTFLGMLSDRIITGTVRRDVSSIRCSPEETSEYLKFLTHGNAPLHKLPRRNSERVLVTGETYDDAESHRSD